MVSSAFGRLSGALVLLICAGIAGMVVGHSPTAPVVYAVDCQPVNDVCAGGDVTKTSAMHVTHDKSATGGTGSSGGVVEPDDSTTWNITAHWRPAMCSPGQEDVEVATTTVTWNGSAWVLSNTTLTDSIVGINICQGDTCSASGTTHSWEYTLIVDIEDPGGQNSWNLKNVKYATTSVDDGDIIDEPFDGGNCAEGTSVSPTTQTFTAWDDPNDKWRSARCPFNCNVVGGSINLTYQ